MKVSVIIPTYNRRDLVSLAIESVLAQTFTDYEVIVVDDGSSDGTGQALATFSSQIRYIWQENQGESVARNQGIALAQGDYIALLDSDDLWEPEKLVEQVAVLDDDPTIVMAGCASRIIDERGELVSSNPTGAVNDPQQLTYSALRYHNHFFGGGSTAVIRRTAIDQVGPFAPELQYGEEWDLWIRLALVGHFVVLPQPLARIRQHGATQTRQMTPEAIDRRLGDYTTILRRNPPLEDSRADPAMAKQYLLAAIDDISIGRLALAEDRLAESQQWDNGHVLQVEGAGMVIARAVALAAPGFTPTDNVLAFVETALQSISARQPLSDARKAEIYGDLYLALAGMARSTHKRQTARRCLWLAWKSNRQVWRKHGFMGGAAESLLGPNLYAMLRRSLPGQAEARS